MNKYFKMLFLMFLFLITIAYIYYFVPLVDDELYNYGFSYSIANGLIPYKDFSMIITPLFSYLLAFLLKITFDKLIIYHMLLAGMIVSIFALSYKGINKSSFIIYMLLLAYPYTGYNMFALFLLFILFYINDKKVKCLDIIEPTIISLMILSKQTLILLAIPNLIFSKNKKKSLVIYLIFMFLFFVYLIINGTFYNFFDYCLFGMFDFANKNSTGINILFILEILIILTLVYFGIKTKRKDIFYCLAFQILAFPIVNCIHFIISFIPCVYLFYKSFKNNRYLIFLFTIIMLSFFLTLNFIYCFNRESRHISKYYSTTDFLENRIMYINVDNYIKNINNILKDYPNYRLYILGSHSYLLKLSLDIPIDKYDLINNGNMGYKGFKKYIEEINDYCNYEKCIFIVNDENRVGRENIQTNSDILYYVRDNYIKIYSSNVFNVYTN